MKSRKVINPDMAFLFPWQLDDQSFSAFCKIAGSDRACQRTKLAPVVPQQQILQPEMQLCEVRKEAERSKYSQPFHHESFAGRRWLKRQQGMRRLFVVQQIQADPVRWKRHGIERSTSMAHCLTRQVGDVLNQAQNTKVAIIT